MTDVRYWVVESNDPGTGERIVQKFSDREAAANLYWYLVDNGTLGGMFYPDPEFN